jgi:hypothetical protein
MCFDYYERTLFWGCPKTGFIVSMDRGEAIDYHKLAYSSIGTYTNATDSHFHAILCEEIGLDQYFWDKRLHQNT